MMGCKWKEKRWLNKTEEGEEDEDGICVFGLGWIGGD